jgi:hypothetical protein
MLTITPGQMAAFEAQMTRERPATFGRWCERYAAILGPIDRFTAAGLFDRYAPEAAIAEIDPDEDLIFVWIAARYRMPEMGNRQYLATMDVIFNDADDGAKLTAIDQIARTIPSDGE